MRNTAPGRGATRAARAVFHQRRAVSHEPGAVFREPAAVFHAAAAVFHPGRAAARAAGAVAHAATVVVGDRSAGPAGGIAVTDLAEGADRLEMDGAAGHGERATAAALVAIAEPEAGPEPERGRASSPGCRSLPAP